MATKTVKKTAKKGKKAVKPLTKTEQMRVDVLRDAIAQLKVGSFRPAKRGYVSIDGTEPEWEEILNTQTNLESIGIKIDLKNKELQKILPNIISKTKPCEICAKGGLAISAIKKFNNVSIGELVGQGCNLDDIASDKAREFFGEENADLMESYYEDWNDRYDIARGHEEKIYEWNDKYGSKTDDLLIAIYSNAVKNRGIFKP